jgi:hypothetical protein
MSYHHAWPLLSSPKTVPPAPVFVQRPPLPPFDPDSVDPDTGAPLPVYTELREPPPAGPEVRWWRGDAWGLTVPGLPRVDGGADGPAQERVLTYFLDRYGRDWEERILKTYRSYGYTHISLSPQDSFAAGQSEDDYVAMAVRCRRAGLFVHHLMRSKYYTPREVELRPGGLDLSAPDALTERLLAEGAMQVHTPAWECNHWAPSTVREMIDHDAALIGARCLIMLHFLPHYISWQEHDEPGDDERDQRGQQRDDDAAAAYVGGHARGGRRERFGIGLLGGGELLLF